MKQAEFNPARAGDLMNKVNKNSKRLFYDTNDKKNFSRTIKRSDYSCEKIVSRQQKGEIH